MVNATNSAKQFDTGSSSGTNSDVEPAVPSSVYSINRDLKETVFIGNR